MYFFEDFSNLKTIFNSVPLQLAIINEVAQLEQEIIEKPGSCPRSRKIFVNPADPIIYPLILKFGSNYKKNVCINEKFVCMK